MGSWSQKQTAKKKANARRPSCLHTSTPLGQPLTFCIPCRKLHQSTGSVKRLCFAFLLSTPPFLVTPTLLDFKGGLSRRRARSPEPPAACLATKSEFHDPHESGRGGETCTTAARTPHRCRDELCRLITRKGRAGEIRGRRPR